MKQTFTTLIILLFLIGKTSVQLFSQCIPTASTAGQTGDFIQDFSFGSISNLNSGDHFCDYEFASDTATFYNGYTYPFTLTTGSSTQVQFIKIWIDFNHNSSFSDPGELVYLNYTGVTSGNIVTGNITIPISALIGYTRLRVLATDNLTSSSCSTSGAGEYEDYIIGIGSKFPCSSIGNYQVNCIPCFDGMNDKITLYVINPPYSTGVSYQWYRSVTVSGPWIPLPSFNNYIVQYTVPGQTQFHFYCMFSCLNTGTISTSNVVTNSINVALPSLLSFEAKKVNSSAHLNWQTKNSGSHFVVERSSDAVTFQRISNNLNSSSNTEFVHFDFVDNEPLSGRNYYRINEIDVDGKSSYSLTIDILFEKEGIIDVYPNPSSSILFVKKCDLKVKELYNSIGQLIISTTENQIDVSSIPNGVYYLKCESKIQRVLIQ